MDNPISQLRNVFAPFSHDTPDPPAGEAEVDNPPLSEPGLEDAGQPVKSDKTGLILQPNLRFDGDSESPPWNIPEPQLCEWLASAEIELVEERVLDGSGGTLWARMRDENGDLRSVFLKMDGVGRQMIYHEYGEEFLLDQESHSLVSRELAAYEVAKACGCEDMTPPMVARDVNLVPLLSDAMRERLARQLRISPVQVDERLGIAATVQLVPHTVDNFVEAWGMIGHDLKSRWERASDRLRHSIFRAIALDFILGVPDRSPSAYLYNRNTDRLAVVNMGLSMPHPGFSAEKYIQQRSAGWGRKSYNGLERPADAGPATAWEIYRLLEGADDKVIDQCLMTFEQVVAGITDDNARHLASILVEHEVPLQSIAGVFARISFLTIEPESVIKRPIEFIRNVMAPIRRGFGIGDERNAQLIEYVNTILDSAVGEPVEFETIAQEELPGPMEFNI